MAKKKDPQKKTSEPPKKEHDLLGQTVSLVEHLISYFETLLIYARKIIREKFKETIFIFGILYFLLGFLFTGFLFFVASVFISYLHFFNNDPVLASLAMGGSFALLSFFLLILLIRKIRKM